MENLPPAAPLEYLIGAPKGDYCVNCEFENQLAALGFHVIAGVDEAGRGPIAGPVVAAAVILNPDTIPAGLDDSKKLNTGKRDLLYSRIIDNSHVSVASVSSREIDQINIRQATLLGMTRAARALAIRTDWNLIDGRDVPGELAGFSSAIIKGDGRSLSVAAASIIAKVTRDKMMIRAADTWPQYGFENHKGYGTRTHIEAINKHGPCPLHRLSFAPLKQGS